MGTTMLRKYGLADWKIVVEDLNPNAIAHAARKRRTRVRGKCYWNARRIALDRWELRDSRYEIRVTFLHEIAHALVPRGTGHGPDWQCKASSLGVPLFDIKRHARAWEKF
jgi:hypothetical protein